MRKLSEFTPHYLELFTRLAVKYNVNVIGGSHFTVEDDDLYNIAYLFRRDGTLGKQYKLHITPSRAALVGRQGRRQRVEVFDTDKGKIAIQICYDIEFPELTRIAVERGAQIIFVPFCTDERYAYLRVRYCAQARCIENHVYVAIAGSVGNLPNVESLGIHYAQSGIFTPSDIPVQARRHRRRVHAEHRDGDLRGSRSGVAQETSPIGQRAELAGPPHRFV